MAFSFNQVNTLRVSSLDYVKIYIFIHIFEHFRRNLTKQLVAPPPAQEVQSLRHYLKDDTKLFCLVLNHYGRMHPLYLSSSLVGIWPLHFLTRHL